MPFALSSAGSRGQFLFPPQQKTAFHESILDELLEDRVVCSRNRINPRGVKRKMSNYKLRPKQRERTRRVEYRLAIQGIK